MQHSVMINSVIFPLLQRSNSALFQNKKNVTLFFYILNISLNYQLFKYRGMFFYNMPFKPKELVYN